MLHKGKVISSIRLALIFIATALTCTCAFAADSNAPVRVAIIGLVHGHAEGLFEALPRNKDIQLVAIVEPDTALANRYATQFHLEQKLFFTNTEKMLDEAHPAA